MIRTYISGRVEEKSKFWVPANTRQRGKKQAGSTSRKRDANEKQAVKQLARLINCNFQRGDALVTLTYDALGFADIGGERRQADRKVNNFLRRLQRRFGKFPWILVTSQRDGESGDPARLHHHLLLPGSLFSMRERVYFLGEQTADEAWGLGTCDVRSLQHQDDYTPLAAYLIRQARNEPDEKKYRSARGECMKRPVVRETMTAAPGPIRTPPGAKLLNSGTYDRETGTHYIRYVRTKKEKHGGHRKTEAGTPPGEGGGRQDDGL